MLGAFLLLLLITRLILLAFKTKKYTVMAVSISLIIGTGIAALIIGIGMTSNNPETLNSAYASAAADLLIPATLVLAVDLIRLWFRRAGQRDGT